MMLLLVVIVCVLAGLLVYEKSRQKQQAAEIRYIIHKVDQILSETSKERVKVISGDKVTRELTVCVNELIDQNRANETAFVRSQESMRKMLSNISHDLKTPLTVILGNLEMMNLNPEEAKHTVVIYQKSQELMNLINEFFNLAKLESGDKILTVKKISLSECARIALLNYYTQLTKLGTKVELNLPEEEIFVQGDQEALVRVLNNLISNAVKYGMDGNYLGIFVEQGKIHVVDHGKGIPTKKQEEIFERMYTLEDSRSREYSGSGLGLTITKALVEAMGAKIKLTSVPNVETDFCIEFSTT